MAKKNILTQGKKARADGLALANRLEEALALCASVCRTDPMDMGRSTRTLLDLLEVGRDDAVIEHTSHARQRSVIRTPSYHQVTQPIHQHAKYSWKRYAADFAAVMPILRPFIEHFGYGQ